MQWYDFCDVRISKVALSDEGTILTVVHSGCEIARLDTSCLDTEIAGLRSSPHEDEIACLELHPEKSDIMVSASRDGSVRGYSIAKPDGKLLLQTSSAVRCLALGNLVVSSDQDKALECPIALGGEGLRVLLSDGDIRLMQAHHEDEVVTRSYNHLACCWLRLATQHIASLGDDGVLRIFDSSAGNVSHYSQLVISGALRRASAQSIAVSCCSFDGIDYIAVPTGTNVALYAFSPKDGLNFVLEMRSQDSHSVFSAFLVSPRTCIAGRIKTKELTPYKLNLRRQTYSIAPTLSLEHEPFQIRISADAIVCFSDHQLGFSNVQIDSHLHSKTPVSESLEEVVTDLKTELRSMGVRNRYLDDEAEEGSEEEEDEGEMEIPSSNVLPLRKSTYASLLDEGSGNSLSDVETRTGKRKGDLDEMDKNSDFSYHGNTGASSCSAPGPTILKPTETVSVHLHELVPIGSTPPSDAGCYLCYNTIGMICKVGEQVTIHFHDLGRLAIRINEQSGIHSASLGENGAMLATATSVFYKSFVSLGTNADWRVQLSPDEEIELVAVGTRCAAISTTKHIRFFTHAGVEYSVMRSPHRVICISMSSLSSKKVDRDLVAVCYEKSFSDLHLHVYNASVQQQILECSLPVKYLSWMGWGEDGFFYVSSREGLLCMLRAAWGNSWLPVYDPDNTIEGSSRYWIWGVAEDAILAQPLQVSEKYYPSYGTVQSAERVKFRVPIALIGTERQQVQREWVLRQGCKLLELKNRAKSYNEDIAQKDIQMDSVLFELFCAFVEEEQTARALDISCLFELQGTLDNAIRHCHTKRLTLLMEKLVTLRKMKHKRKRVSDLPDPGHEISDKEKDTLFRKVIQWEKERQKQVTSPRLTEKLLSPVKPSLPPSAIPNPQSVRPVHNQTRNILEKSSESPVEQSSATKMMNNVEIEEPDADHQLDAVLEKDKVSHSASSSSATHAPEKADFKKTRVFGMDDFEKIHPNSRNDAPNQLQSLLTSIVPSSDTQVADVSTASTVPKVEKYAPKRPTTVMRKRKAVSQPVIKKTPVASTSSLGSISSAALDKKYKDQDSD